MADEEDPPLVEALMGWDAAAASRREVAFFRSRDARGSRMLTLSVEPDGTVQIGGQDLGPIVSEAFGKDVREYEWYWTLRAADVPRALQLLGGSSTDGLPGALRRWAEANAGRDPGQYLRESGFDLGFWSRVGD